MSGVRSSRPSSAYGTLPRLYPAARGRWLRPCQTPASPSATGPATPERNDRPMTATDSAHRLPRRGVRRHAWLVLLLATLLLTGGAALRAARPEAAAAPAHDAAAPRHAPGGEANLVLPDLTQVRFIGVWTAGRCSAWASSSRWPASCSGSSSSCSSRTCPCTARCASLRADLRDLQDLSVTQGKFILILEVFIGVDHRALLRRAASSLRGRSRVVDHPALQPHRHRRQLRRGVVRHPRQHLRQLAHGVRQPAQASRSRSTRFRCRPA